MRIGLSNKIFWLGCSALLVAMTTLVNAQTSRGTITGTVTDASGAIIAHAAVKITRVDTNTTRDAVTNDAGIYRFDAVDLGVYTVTAQAPGFGVMTKTGIEVQAARTTEIDFNLKVGSAAEQLTVEASTAEVALQTSEQVRGEHFSTAHVARLPLLANDPLTLTQIVPGVSLGNTNSINQNGNMFFAVNGQRPRGNNFMIDGVENNDISITGPAYTITNPDAVQEVSVQTSNFSAEFGRAGGAVINQVIKSGTNSFHGSATYEYTGSAFKALNYADKHTGLTRPPRDVENIPSFSVGGPVVIPKIYNGRGKTFFFAAAQWDHRYRKTTLNVRVPTEAGVATLQALAGQCSNAALYLQAIGSLRGNPAASPSNVSIAAPSAAGTCNNSARTGQSVATGLFTRQEPRIDLDSNHQIRIDQVVSQKQNMSFRWLYDRSDTGPTLNNLPGFDRSLNAIALTMAFADTYVINSHWTNEFRFNYGRIGFDFVPVTFDAFHFNLPNYTISEVTGFGRATNMPQFRFANNWQYQDTQTIVKGTHTFRYGVDFLRQLARQLPPFNGRGSLTYRPAGTTTGLANFLDDFGGNGAAVNRTFGNAKYYPNLFRQAYFFQDSWKATQSLVLNLGLRYENFGAPENIFTVAAFTNYDPVNFLSPHKVKPDNNNFAPSIGFSWSPKGGDNFISRLLGNERTVWRGGYQVTYDTWFNNLLSNIAGGPPNVQSGTGVSNSSTSLPRGTANWTAQFNSIQPAAITKATAQQSLFDPNMRNPYTQRWSLGFQREMPLNMVLDVSYVGSVGRKLFRTVDMNPVVNTATGDRLHPELQITTSPVATRRGEGIRDIRTSGANSNYNGLQVGVRRRFSNTPLGALLLDGSYTWSHFLDEISDVFAQDSTNSSFQSVSQVLGASPRLDYGESDFDRRHVGSLAFVWDLRGPKQGVLGQVLGGWSLSGISHWQTGSPYTVSNGTDRNGDGQTGPDRPDIGNPSAPLNTRAVIKSTCSTGYGNPDVTGTPCVDPNTVHFLEGAGLPNARTLRRNQLRTPGIGRLDLTIGKAFRLTERMKLDYHVGMFNALNTVNLSEVPAIFAGDRRTVNGTSAGSFLDFTQNDSTGRSMRMGLRLSW